RPCRAHPAVTAMPTETIRTPSGQMPAYVAIPPGAGPWPGVIVIHDWGGMSRDLAGTNQIRAPEQIIRAPFRFSVCVSSEAPNRPGGGRTRPDASAHGM